MKHKLLFVLLLSTLVVVPSVSAIGLMSLPLGEIVYQPGTERQMNFYVRNYNYNVEAYVSGDIAPYATVSKLTDTGNGMKQFTVLLDWPRDVQLPAGTHYLLVGVREVGTPGGTVGALTAAQKNLKVDVYSEDKEIKVTFDAPNGNEGEDLVFRVSAKSYSYQDIDEVSAEMTIYDSQNKTITTLTTPVHALPSGGSASLDALWDTEGIGPGDYWVEADVFYDGKSMKVKDTFKIGTLQIKIDNYSKDFVSGHINEFNLDIESVWNSEISNVFGELFIDNKLAVRTPSVELQPFGKERISTFWNVSYPPGEYGAKLVLQYGNTFTEKHITVNITEPERATNSTAVVLVGMAALVLVVFLVAQYIYSPGRRKEKDKKKRRKRK